MRTNEGPHEGRALGSGLQALPSDAQLAKGGGQAVKACAAGPAGDLQKLPLSKYHTSWNEDDRIGLVMRVLQPYTAQIQPKQQRCN